MSETNGAALSSGMNEDNSSLLLSLSGLGAAAAATLREKRANEKKKSWWSEWMEEERERTNKAIQLARQSVNLWLNDGADWIVFVSDGARSVSGPPKAFSRNWLMKELKKSMKASCCLLLFVINWKTNNPFNKAVAAFVELDLFSFSLLHQFVGYGLRPSAAHHSISSTLLIPLQLLAQLN